MCPNIELPVGSIDGCVDCVDADSDGVEDSDDNCPCVPNGRCTVKDDFCNANPDNDAMGPYDPTVDANELAVGNQIDMDNSGIGDACEDVDADDVFDWRDNCPFVVNADQADIDGDGEGEGDACRDTDGDGVLEPVDNCPASYNTTQANFDADEFGDVCDICPLTADNNPEICKADEDPFPIISLPVPPIYGGQEGANYENMRGGGGCSVVPAGNFAGWLSVLLASAGVLGIFRNRKTS